MLDRNNAVPRIAREVLEVEDAINNALACAAALSRSVALGRMIDGVSKSSAQESIVRLAAVQQHLSRSATEMTRVHRDLRRTHDEITAMPDGNGDCPELGVPVTGVRAA